MMVFGVVMGAAWLAPKRQSADGQSADEQSTDLAVGLNGKTHWFEIKNDGLWGGNGSCLAGP